MSLNDANATDDRVRGIVRSYSDKLEAKGTEEPLEMALVAQEKKDKRASDAENVRYRKWNAFLLDIPQPR